MTKLADQPDHPFERILNGGVEYSQVHSTPRESPPFQKRSWHKANPGLRHLPDLEAAIRKEVKRARKDPMALASFRALRLNQGVSDTTRGGALLCRELAGRGGRPEPTSEGPFCAGPRPRPERQPVGCQLPTGTGRATVRRLRSCPTTPTSTAEGWPTALAASTRRRRSGGRSTLLGDRVADIPGLLVHALALWGAPEAISCDRWRIAELAQSLDAVGFPRSVRSASEGQGYKDGAEDVRGCSGRPCWTATCSPNGAC